MRKTPARNLPIKERGLGNFTDSGVSSCIFPDVPDLPVFPVSQTGMGRAEGVGGGMARAESPSSAVPWMKRERAGGSGGAVHNVKAHCDSQVGEM